MTSELNRELASLNLELAERQRHIEDQMLLIEVLEQDGHDVSEQELALKKKCAELAQKIARRLELLQNTSLLAQ